MAWAGHDEPRIRDPGLVIGRLIGGDDVTVTRLADMSLSRREHVESGWLIPKPVIADHGQHGAVVCVPSQVYGKAAQRVRIHRERQAVRNARYPEDAGRSENPTAS
jgi:hypothetical protein